MRLFASATTAAAILTAGSSLAIVMLRSPIGDPVFERAPSPQADRSRRGAAHAGGGVPATRRPATPARAAGNPVGAAEAAGYAPDARARSPVRIDAAEMAAGVPRPATRPPATPDASGSVSRVMYCHLDTGGNAATLLQACIDRAPAFSSVEVPPGIYTLDRRVLVSRPVTLRTAGTAGTETSCVATPAACATLLASHDFIDPYGVLLVWNTGSVMLQDLVIDGNRAARLTSTAARWCERGRTSSGFNAAVLECVGCSMDDVVSKNALCGTGMLWSGARAAIGRSEFRDNGDARASHMWADGLTVPSAAGRISVSITAAGGIRCVS